METALDAARELAAHVKASAGASRVVVLGPAPAPLAKLRGELSRAVLLERRQSRRDERTRCVAALAAKPALARRTAVDVDPVSML